MSELERCEVLPGLLETKPSDSVPVRGSSLSRAVTEMFPDSVRAVTVRERAARLTIQCPLLSITAVAKERLKPGSVRGKSLRPTTVEWREVVVGGRAGSRTRSRQRIPSYVNILMTCA